MISEKMEKALNDQINEELYSAYLYLAMSAWFESQNLPGFASWMKVQMREENVHAMKFFEYIHERRGRAVLKAVKEPGQEWKSPLAAFEAALQHEQHITGCIGNLMNQALAEKDHATAGLLQWFVKEQVEEEEHASEIVARIAQVGDVAGHLFCLDHDLGKRE
jgi:ferritin